MSNGKNRILKRFLSVLMSVCLTAGLLWTRNVSAFASTELPNESLGQGGRCEGTAFQWLSPTRFDMCGLRAGQTEYGRQGVQTTFGWGGYGTFIQVGNGAKTAVSIPTNGGVQEIAGGVEVKMTLSASQDNKYILVDYYVYDKNGQGGTAGRTVKLGSGADVMIGTDDRAIIYKNDRGFHMVNRTTQETFDCITNDENLGVTPPTTRYIGQYSNWANGVFTEAGGAESTGYDSEIAYSWHFQLHPYEVVHRRVAFAVRDTSYYVHPTLGSDGAGADGTYTKPYKSIEHALGKLENKKGYLFIMEDYPAITAPITISGTQDITVASTDYTIDGTTTSGEKRLKRGGNYKGPMFTTNGGTLRLTDIILDGEGKSSGDPLLKATAGRMEINSGAQITNCRGDGTSSGSAVSVTGSASLSMNFGKVSGNVTDDHGKGAVYFNSTGTFEVVNDVLIEDNTTTSGKKANVYLDSYQDGQVMKNRFITVTGDLNVSKIGVTTQLQPEASPGGVSSKAGQEIKIAVPAGGSAVDTAPCPFADNFFADQSDSEEADVYISVGTKDIPNTTHNDRNAVIKKNGYMINFSVRERDTGGAVSGAPAIPSVPKAFGEQVDIEQAIGVLGYEISDVIIVPKPQDSPLTGSVVKKNEGQSNEHKVGKVTGTMPKYDVEVIYEMKKIETSLFFVSNGGTPEPPTLTGVIGSPVTSSIPVISKYGYDFKGWSPDTHYNSYISSLPPVFDVWNHTYYAHFVPNDTKFHYTVEHESQSGKVVFAEDTLGREYSVETPLQEQKKTIRFYDWSQEDSDTTPIEYNFGGISEPIGSFDGNGVFRGKMPGQDATVRYRYKVRNGDTSARSTFTVRHETNNFNTVAPTETGLYYPEEAVATRPAEVYGFECTGYEFETGKYSGNWSDGYVYGIEDGFDEDFVFNSFMPNQNVTLVYKYTATLEGYELAVKYEDNDTQDPNLVNIIEPVVTGPHAADSVVGGRRLNHYGYTVASSQVKPDNATIWPVGDTWGGTMPNDNAEIIYRHNRVLSKWADITFMAGERGTLVGGEGVSPDVQALAGGAFKASVLINDASLLGQRISYTLADIKTKRLMPIAQADSLYYRFGGWFIDGNNNGELDGGETLLPEDYRFTGPETITAFFEENPDAWMNIYFEAGEHGSINAGEPDILRVTFDKTWGDILTEIPDVTPEVNYLEDDWYVDGEAVRNDTPLQKDKIYTMQFYPDPAVFGTDVSEPEAAAGLNTYGKGRITVFGTTSGYQYILTDLAGEVLAVNKGNILTGRTIFDDLYPGMRFRVHEATGKTTVEVGDVIGAGATISSGREVLTPVLETNYQILYDEEDEGKTQLTIRPADQSSDYAVLDDHGTVARGWKKPSGNPAGLTFDGLDYNREYTVVARPAGLTEITEESRADDGSIITTDPGGELDLPVYIIETIHGEIGSVAGESVGMNRFEEAHKGDQVVIAAETADSAGNPFLYWEFLIGAVKGLGVRVNKPDVSFSMPDTNLVLSAVYERPVASPSNASVAYEVRGGSRAELALSPDEIPVLEEELTTDTDRGLLDVNGADVTYKVVYRTSPVVASESNAVKAGGDYDMDHEDAYKGAWGLDVSIERYVNGRQVAMASPSNASFTTYVQLDKDDVDMLDYQLYELGTDPDGEPVVTLVPMHQDPEGTGGLFTFTAEEGKRYLMVYNRAYRLYFLNNTLPEPYRYFFKVRREEAPSDSWYALEYGALEEQEPYYLHPSGAEYRYEDWSYRPDQFRRFDPDRKVTRKTYVYAFYKNNRKEVDDTRRALEEEIRKAIGISDDYFLKVHESRELKELIENALEVLDQENPKAAIGQLKTALNRLKEDIKPYEERLENRYDHYEELQDSGNKGGSGGGGGGGGGTRKDPFKNTPPKSYRVGTNGSWIESRGPSGEKLMSFRLNGGKQLTNMWAQLEYPEGSDTSGNGWYRFNEKGIMQSGWISDESGKWYYCNTEKDGHYGKMATGWKLDGNDGNWYYLDPASGAMGLGWIEVGGKWYYFSPTGAGVYTYDPARENWIFGGGSGRPLGSMYKNEVTPDGYLVGADGAWIR